MHPRSLLLTIALYLSATLCTSEEVVFTTQLGFQQPFEIQDQLSNHIQFIPSPPISSTLRSRPTTVYRPRSLDALHNARLSSLQHAQSAAEQPIWDPFEVEGPDVEDLHTLAQLARMSGNAYALPGQKNWYDVDQVWNNSFPFGWEASDGFRGHVFLSSDNSTIVLSIKGTTVQGRTSKVDKFNDNLLFSCCCARVDFSWIFNTVCDCYARNFRCDNQCLTDALVQDSLFYSIGVRLVDDLRRIYPLANLWLVGHSLGGALASLLGATYGLPAVAFEAPGERLAASRLHLPLPPPIIIRRPEFLSLQSHSFWSLIPYFKSLSSILGNLLSESRPKSVPLPSSHHPVATTHIYHTADPIPQGACTGFRSPCANAGYALETRCHLGQSIVFDSVQKLRWKVDIRKHIIRTVVHDVLEGDVWWGDDNEEEYEAPAERPEYSQVEARKHAVPKPMIEDDCNDCYKWEFGDFKDEIKRKI